MVSTQDDLKWRVASVSVWASEQALLGVQLHYKHYETGEKKSGPATWFFRVRGSSISTSRFELINGEFLVAVVGHNEADALVGIALLTSFRRRVIMTTSLAVTMAGMDPETPVSEIRHLDLTLACDRIEEVRAVSKPLQTLSDIATIAKATQDHVQGLGTYTVTTTLCSHIAILNTLIRNIVDRGIVYPISLVLAYEELLSDCRTMSAWRWYGTVEGYVARCEAIKKMYEQSIAQTELARLKDGGPLAPRTSKEAKGIVRDFLRRGQCDLAVGYYVKSAASVHTNGKFLREIAAEICNTSQRHRLVDIVAAYTAAKGISTSNAMETFEDGGARFVEAAVSAGDQSLLKWLVAKALVNPLEDGAEDATHEDTRHPQVSNRREHRLKYLCALLDKSFVDTSTKEGIKDLLVRHKNQQDFEAAMANIATDVAEGRAADITDTRLRQLIPKITGIHDFTQLYVIGKSFIDTTSLRELISDSCAHIYAEKLVLDDDECTFLEIALRQAFADNVLDQFEYVQLKNQNRKVNMESAAWVNVLKQRIQQIEEQKKAPKPTLISRAKLCIQRLRDLVVEEANPSVCKPYIAVLGALLWGAGMFWVCREYVDLTKPLNMLNALLDKARFPDQPTTEKLKSVLKANPDTVWSPTAKAFLDKLRIAPAPFLAMLVNLVHQEETAGKSSAPHRETSSHRTTSQARMQRQQQRSAGIAVASLASWMKELARSGVGFLFWEAFSIPVVRFGSLSLLTGAMLIAFQNRWKLAIATLLVAAVLWSPLNRRVTAYVQGRAQTKPRLLTWLPQASFALLTIIQLVGKFKFIRTLQEDTNTALAVTTSTSAALILALTIGPWYGAAYRWGSGRRLRFVAYVTALACAIIWGRTHWTRLAGPVLIDTGVLLIMSVTGRDARHVYQNALRRLSDYARTEITNDTQTASSLFVEAASGFVNYLRQPSAFEWNKALGILNKAKDELLALVAQKDDFKRALNEALDVVCPSTTVGAIGLAALSFPSSVVLIIFRLQYGAVAIAAFPFIASEAIEGVTRYQSLENGIEDGLDMVLLSSPLLRLWAVSKQSVRKLLEVEARIYTTTQAINGAFHIATALVKLCKDAQTNGWGSVHWTTHAQDAPALLSSAASIRQAVTAT